MTVFAAGLRNPTAGAFARNPRSIRRTSHIDMVFDGPPIGGRLELRGRARDVLTDEAREPETLREAEVSAALDESRRLRSLVTNPATPAAQALLDTPVSAGFRAALDRALPVAATERPPLYLLLDDLPVAALISGYAGLYTSDQGAGVGDSATAGRDTKARMVKADICAGWRSDGTMMVALNTENRMPTPVGPPAPSLAPPDDPYAWHDIPALGPTSMRRRRLVDVTWGDPLVVRAMFRDTHKSATGDETVLHEYTVDVAVDLRTLVVVASEATPRALPWKECPEAAASARRLEGQPVADLRRFVRKELTGTSTCTHLNDLLRSLADVDVLARVLRERFDG